MDSPNVLQARKQRAVTRASFTRAAQLLDGMLCEETFDVLESEATFNLLAEKMNALKILDEQVMKFELEADYTEEQINEEVCKSDEYLMTFLRLKTKFNRFQSRTGETHLASAHVPSHPERKFKLPNIELKTFSGDLRDWLSFWSQFKKVHEDDQLAPEDKFQYLISAMTPGTRAKELIDSFPPTSENYCKAIESLKSRFGREDVLVEVYVRELLKIVLNNVMSHSRCSLTTLYDTLETQLRALETLGVTTDTCAAMLYPLVESCLPEDVLRAWQRSADHSGKASDSIQNRLDKLMTFLKIEVESEERISLAVKDFGGDSRRVKKDKCNVADPGPSTAAGLVNNSVITKCTFCSGNHASSNCFKARNMKFEDKRKILFEKKACFRCAQSGHQGRKCRKNLKCLLCGESHLVLLCPTLNRDNTESLTKKHENAQISMSNFSNVHVFLQTLVVKLQNEQIEKQVRVIIDTGSQRSYILTSLAEKMGYPLKRSEKVKHALFGGTLTKEQLHNCYNIVLKSLDREFACNFDVLDQSIICNHVPQVFDGIWSSELRKLKISLTDTGSIEEIGVLIGADIAGKLITGNKRQLKCGLVALETLLGWVLMGKAPIERRESNVAMVVTSLYTTSNTISNFWRLDLLGIDDPRDKKSKIEMENVIKQYFRETVIHKEGRYEVTLPWKEDHRPLPSDYGLSRRRLQSVVRKLKLNENFNRYDIVFQEWLAEGIIEEVPEKEKDMDSHYLPHRPVFKESSLTTKVRPVFDASARESGKPCLNDCLEKGINLIELIPTILFRFRADRIGVISDIRKAFLQISLRPEDRNFLRFLWQDEQGAEKMFRHRRVVFGVNSSPFLLGATIEYHLDRYNNGENLYSLETLTKLKKAFYVDNCVTSVSDEETKDLFINEATSILAEGGFDLVGWECSQSCGEIPVLGIKWNKEKDVLKVNEVPQLEEQLITKRVILSYAQKVFDPIGFSCPAILFVKLLLQEMWKTGIGWDSEVDEKIKITFRKWVNELIYIFKIEIPRWIKNDGDSKKSLHVFCDASGAAYGVAVFLRVEMGKSVNLFLIQAKSRVAPLKKMSIPRLELLAATIAARLYFSILSGMADSVESHFWTDSTTVLGWIQRREEWSTFVWNRVKEIRDLTDVKKWRYVPSELNPADLPSRGCFPKRLYELKWWEGPSWLLSPQSEWPTNSDLVNEEEISFFAYFSKYRKNIRMVGWMMRYIHNSRVPSNLRRGDLSPEEEEHAEKKLIYLVQKESFSEKDNRLPALKVFKDEDGLLRVQTRISAREDLNTFLYPFLLPGNHCLTKKLIFDQHVRYCHAGIQTLMTMLRERFWILGGRRSIRAVIARCYKCRRFTAKRADEETPILPADRVRDAACFEVVGVDLAGPLFLRDGKKVWICLFTCAVYRAVHLELVECLSSGAFLRVLRRFIARRGRPKVIYSDNGKNFIGTANLLSQLNWDEIIGDAAIQRIRWCFNPPSAPWWGGWWERLIGMLKQLLRKVLANAHLEYDELHTILCDCEAVVNSRPLTYESNQPSELRPLTPVMFLRDLHENGVLDCDRLDSEKLKGRFRYVQKIRADLRKRFRSEYLGQLKQNCLSNQSRRLNLNEIVLIGNENIKRLDWPLGRVQQLIKGRDGKVRLARIRTQFGVLLRPIRCLYSLEVGKPELAMNAFESTSPTD